MAIYYCPNVNCPNETPFKRCVKCPDCGTFVEKIGLRESVRISVKKKELKKVKEIKNDNFLIAKKMSDEEIEEKNIEEIIKLNTHIKANESTLGKLNDIFTGSTSDRILRTGFNALICQNNILIRQNELILRLLKEETSK